MPTGRQYWARLFLAFFLIIGLVPYGSATLSYSSPSTAADCLRAGLVWVHVEWESGSKGGCATEFSTGLAALSSAGFAVNQSGGFVNSIDGLPNPKGVEDWWSYWHKPVGADGSYPQAWEFSDLGAGSYRPQPGTVEGWRLWHSYSESAQQPLADPAASLTVRTAPKFTTQPSSLTVETGSAATFSVQVSGLPKPTISWLSSLDGNTWMPIDGAVGTSYTISGTSASQDGLRIKARATNVAGSVESGIATLTLKAASGSVQIPDAGLRACVAKAAGVGEGQLTPAKVSAVTDLTCVNAKPSKVVDLTGIHQLTGLRALNLNTNAIADLSPLSAMTGLTKLWVSGNKLTDITPMQGLINLEDVMISRNEISNITALTRLGKLRDLSLDYNQISDLSALANKPHLTRLVANRNKIASLKPLESLADLTTLAVMQNELIDVSPLARLAKLTTLLLAQNRIVDAAPLAGLTTLQTLDLSGNALFDISALSKITPKMLGFKARGQRVVLPAAVVNIAVVMPTIKDRQGRSPVYLKPVGEQASSITIKGGSVTYASTGKEQSIAFSDSSSALGNEFSGTIVREVASAEEFDRPKAAAAWLFSQTKGGAQSGSNDDTRDWGNTIDTLFVMKAAGAPADQVSVVGNAIESHARDYATYDSYDEPGVVIAGAMGKVLVAASVLDRDVNNFGDMDVRARALATVGADGVRGQVADIGKFNNANLFGQALVMIGLARTGDLPADTVTFLATQQCAAGYFRIFYTDGKSCDDAQGSPDRDATAMGVMALRAAKAKGIAAADAPLQKAVKWLVADQHQNGSFVGSPWTPKENSNSTGLVASALAGLEPELVAKAGAWIASIQVVPATAGAASAELGAIAYDEESFLQARSGGIPTEARQTWRYATAQALYGLAPIDLYSLSPGKQAVKADSFLRLERGEITAGQVLAMQGRGFRPMEQVTLTLYSDPVQLGVVNADANGEFAMSTRIPDTVPAGLHTLVALGAMSGGRQAAALSVLASSGGSPSPAGSAESIPATDSADSTVPGSAKDSSSVPSVRPKPLPTTGAEAAVTLLGLVAFLACGLAGIVGRRTK